MRVFAFVLASLLAAGAQAANVYLSAPRIVDAGLPFTLQVNVLHPGGQTGVEVTVDLRGADGVTRLPNECRAAGVNQVVCGFDGVPYENPERKSLRFDVVAGLHTVGFTATLRSNEGAFDRREESVPTYETFFVTTADDDGPGSLREAIRAATPGLCTDSNLCKIAFRIPPNGAKWHTIRPRTPLPPVTGPSLTIDGTTQGRYFADTNPDGPEIEINGAALSAGDGLTTHSCVVVRGLAVNGFPGQGIVVSEAAPCTNGIFRFATGISGCYLGVDPSGTTAVPNERGVVVNAPIGFIGGSVISGNRRSGVFLTDHGRAHVSWNVIGLNAAKTAPLGNGASGIYIARGARGSDVVDNYIGFNQHAGLSIATDAWWVAIRGNSFQANWGLAIDYALDGVSPSVPFAGIWIDGRTVEPFGQLSHPTILSAVYDAAADATTIEAEITATPPSPFYTYFSVNFYANDQPDPSGFGEGQYYLGNVSAEPQSNRVILRLKGRTPGPWISATATGQTYYGYARTPDPDDAQSGGDFSRTVTTSEFSRTVRVAEQ